MRKHPPWKILITVSSLAAIALTALVVDQVEIAALAAGALAGYLGKVNGAATPSD